MKNYSRKLTKTSILIILIASGVAMAQDKTEVELKSSNDLSFSIGVRTWVNDWQSNGVTVNNKNQPILSHVDSETKSSLIPFALVRYRDLGFSASTLLSTNYASSDGITPSYSSRKEFDANVLYYFLPSASISLGYKNLEWTGVSMSGLTVGLSASAPISDRLGIYGTLGLGKLKTTIGDSTYDANYSLIEAGLGYSLGSVGKSIKSTAVTLGYRQQRIKAANVFIGNGVYRDVNDNTSGVTAGVVASF